MKINILSPGRFHVCDLARELDKCGHDVHFYSFVSTLRTSKFSLPNKCNKSLFGIMLPFLCLMRLFPASRFLKTLTTITQDYITGIYMRKCDILIAMSGSYVYSLKVAQKQGSIIILERGSKHILEQRRILENIPSLKGTKPVPDINVKRELTGYQLANYISIAAQHVKESFLLHNYPVEKLFINPYGVDTSMFHPVQEIEKKYDIIMTGNWSYQKGCDIIHKVCIRNRKLKFLHVGPIGDLKFPELENMTHINKVDQSKLIKYYSQAKIFIFPSRQEGLSMVQAQAMACGLPIICSKHSGGEDLQSFLDDKKWIIVINELRVNELNHGIAQAIALVNMEQTHENYAENALKQLTWEAYGKRYHHFLLKISQ